MTPSITDARGRLRAADPAADLPDDALWPAPAARDALDRAVAGRAGTADGTDDANVPPRGLPADVTELVPSPRRRHGRRYVPLAAAAAVLVVAGSVAAIEATSGSGAQHPSAVGGPGASVSPSGGQTASVHNPPNTPAQGASSSAAELAQAAADGRNRAMATAAVERALAQLPVLPGATRVDRAPTKELRAGSSNSILVDREEWWTAPGDLDSAISYLTGHVPRGWMKTGTGQGANVKTGTILSRSIELSPPVTSTSAYSDMMASLVVAPYQGGVAVRAEVQATWLPARSAAEHIPGDVTSVAVALSRPNLPAVHRTLTGPAVRRLAGVINAQSVATPGDSACPAGRGDQTDVLTFATAAGPLAITAYYEGCMGVRVSADGKSQPALDGAGTIDRAVVDALGLPSSYRFGG